MERIEPGGYFPSRRTGSGSAETRKKGRLGGGFLSFLRSSEDAATAKASEPRLEVLSEEEVQALLDEIHQAGDRLKDNPTMTNTLAYKEAVQDFLSGVVGGGFGVEEHTSGSSIHKRKRFTLVQVINRKLERLAALMLESQQSQIDLLAKVEEINGLLVDLMH
jgi:hypothetical protein